ncbi:MAG TPA: ABC transporter substrate-binding protein [Candidatus Nitrosotalea sp.]|nr:ABC transporter substrate-binding protein [Candidatus Nitrosotalea sp.]
MDRRAFLHSVTMFLLAVPLAAGAQQPGKMVRIGLLDYGAPNPSSAARWKALREQLRQLGYLEGQNVVFEPRWGDGQVARLPGLAAELVGIKVDIVVTATSEAARAAKQATTSIPIVMATSGDPVELGLVESLARPGGNVTGVISLNSDLVGKRLELLKQMIPRASRIAVLRDPDNRTSTLSVRAAESAGKSLGVVVQSFDARERRDFEAAFLAMKRAHADAVILGVNTPFVADRKRIAELAIQNRLAMMTPAKEYAEAGALVSYGTDYPDQFRRAATYVDKILKGARPGDLPVEQPTKFELVVNLKTAKVLGLTIPPSLLQRADQLIE